MPPSRPLGNESIFVIRAPLVRNERTNSDYRDWDNATETEVKFCNVQPFPLAEKLNEEVSISREYARSSIRIYAPAGTDIRHTDRIRYRGNDHDVFGFAGDWQDFSGTPHHVAVVARRREG